MLQPVRGHAACSLLDAAHLVGLGSRLTRFLVGLCKAPSWHGSSNELGLSCKTCNRSANP